MEKYKKLKLYQKDRKKEIIELTLYLKRLLFINPLNIPTLYKISKINILNLFTMIFLDIFVEVGILNVSIKN